MAIDFDANRGSLGRESKALAAEIGKLLARLVGTNDPTESQVQDPIAQSQSRDRDFSCYEYRLTLIEQCYRKRSSGLDRLLGQVQSTSSFLSERLKEQPFDQYVERIDDRRPQKS